MPPCKSVLLNKIYRTNYLAKMVKFAQENTIDQAKDGWYINESNEMEIEYFSGDPFPDNMFIQMI